ncbi:MAG: hypothetical protein GY733_22840 [bacterium]|nr:hypothetical protein [bacterium]
MRDVDGHFYSALVWSISALLLAAGGALLLMMLAAVIGPFRFLEIDFERERFALGIWVPEYAGAAPSRAARRRVESWVTLAEEDTPVFQSPRLAELVDARVSVVIVPDGRRLDAAQRKALEDHVRGGGAAILTGSVGVRDARGQWLGYEGMRELLDQSEIVPLDREQAAAIASHRPGPLSAPLFPGRPVSLLAEPGVPGFVDAAAELTWSPTPEEPDSAEPFAASLRREIGLGRLAWFGPGPEHVVEAHDRDRRDYLEVFRAAIDWVRREPHLELLPWPNGAARFDHGPAAEARWVRVRDRVVARLRRAGPQRLLVDVTNTGSVDVQGLVVRLRFNRPVAEVRLGGTTVLQEATSMLHHLGGDSAGLILPDLSPGRSLSLYADYVPQEPGRPGELPGAASVAVAGGLHSGDSPVGR